MTNKDKFLAEYQARLQAAYNASPENFHWRGVHTVESVASRMVVSLAQGNASLSTTVVATARALGVKPTMRDIKKYLNS